jgi:hypothetical protein
VLSPRFRSRFDWLVSRWEQLICAEQLGMSHIWAQESGYKVVAPPEFCQGLRPRNFMGITSNGDLLYSVMEPGRIIYCDPKPSRALRQS